MLIGLSSSIAMLVVLDVLVGIAFCRDGRFRRWPLPPYSLVFKDSQLEWLKQEDWPYFRFDPHLGWSLRPNGVFDEGRYRANAAGIRADREYALKPPQGATRIAAFGDSYIHGSAVDNTDTAMYLLEQSRPDLEVLNFGVPGYGTDQAYLRYVRDGAQYHPHIVLIGLMVENIQRNVTAFRPAYFHNTGLPLAKPRFRLDADGALELLPCPAKSLPELRDLVATGRLVDTLQKTDYWVARAPLAYRDSPLFGSSIVRIVYAAYENSGRTCESYYQDPASEPFQVTVQILQEFCARAINDGAERAIVLIFPDKTAVREQLEGKPAFWRSMTDHLATAGVAFIDLTPSVVEAVRRDGIDAHFNGSHYSPAGNAVVAETLLTALFP